MVTTEIIIVIMLALLMLMHVVLMYMLLAIKEKFADILRNEKFIADFVRSNNEFVFNNTNTMKEVLKREETMVKLVDATNECYEVFKKQNKAIVEAFHKASKNYDQILKEWEIAEGRYSEIYEQYDEIKKRVNDISDRLPYTRPITITPYTSPITITPPPAFEPGPLGYEVTCDTKGAETVNE